MSVMLNIGPTDDPTYRYKMPKLITKIEGRGNGIKTVCVNMVDVAEALNRDPSLPTKVTGAPRGRARGALTACVRGVCLRAVLWLRAGRAVALRN